jgi:hypothetical protein
MTRQSAIDYKIEQLEKLSGLKLRDVQLLKTNTTYSHRLEGKETSYITPRYDSKKEFYYVLDSMVNLLKEMQELKESQK